MRFKEYLIESKTYKPPQGAVNAAKKAIEWKEQHGDAVKGGTQVGWTRAGQLARGEALSLDIVKRMYSFFSRHEGNKNVNAEYKDEPWRDNGYIAWLIWGGDAAYAWSKNIVQGLQEKYYNTKELHTSYYDGIVEVFVNPTNSEMFSLFRTSYDQGVRMGVDNKGNLYMWIEDVLHDEIQKKFNLKFVIRMEYTKGRDTLFLSSGESKKNFEQHADKKLIAKLKTLFPLAKKIETSTSPFVKVMELK